MEETSQINIQNLVIAPLQVDNAEGAFANLEDPENPELLSWFRDEALSAQLERKSKTYLVCHDSNVVGYATVSTSQVRDIPGVTNHTSYNFQVVLAARLYTVPSCRSMGIGTVVMDFILDLAKNMDEMIGCMGILLDAKNNERTVSFYERYGFQEINRNSHHVQMFFKIPEQPPLPE